MHPLPRLIVISDGVSNPAIEQAAIDLLHSKQTFWLHIRDLWAPDKPFNAAATRIVEHIKAARNGRLATVNSRLEIAARLNIGYHASGRGPWIPVARSMLGEDLPIGASIHSAEEARIAERADADYVVFTPVYPSPSSEGHPGLGLTMLEEVAHSIEIPVFAMGGLTPERVAACMKAGAYGVGALSGIFNTDDAAEAVDRFYEAIG